MADVRLTATNPEDSSVVPVACNAKGELLLEEPQVPEFDGNVDGDLTVTGSGKLLVGTSSWTASAAAVFSGSSGGTGSGTVYIGRGSVNLISGQPQGFIRFTDTDENEFANIGCWTDAAGVTGTDTPGRLVFSTTADGSSSPTERLRIESSGMATFASDVVISSRNKQWMIVESNGLAHLVEQTRAAEMQKTTYPPLRDIPGELTMVEQQLQRVLEKLRMVPEAGWEVWDGSDEN